ncbi:MAG TPA: hypothetical protein VE133_13520 [Candidatus Sulfotelmatobacter sp.]|jgi:hypothetical protein|nr:hypothetical protein [Candidatus Sulfotelmatobacter sp.]
MKCEICRAIERLGLEPSAHELWYCPDAVTKKAALRRASRPELEQFARELCAFLLLKWRQGRHRNWALAHLKPRLVTLGI